MDDKDFMIRAIENAKLGEGFTNPNPIVGAVIVKDGKILAEGYHHRYGDLHAERDALENLKKKGLSAEGATLFVTLEPCSHFGKQPPCSHAIVESKIKKVVVGSRDPNPLVSGKGNAYLRENGIEVQEDFMKEECDALNQIFFHYITTKTPYIALKYAMTMDGKIATENGSSRWITNDESRTFVHKLRRKYSSILCGIKTVIKDDPLLNCRIENPKNPVRIVLDSKLRLPLECRLVKTAREIKTIISCVKCEEESFLERKNALLDLGVEVLELSATKENHPDLKELFKILGERNIDSVLVEGGGEVNFSLLKENLVNHIYAFVGAKVFGGNGKSPVTGKGVSEVGNAFDFRLENISRFGDDVLLEYRV